VEPSDRGIGNPSFPVLFVDDHFGFGTKYQKYSYRLEVVMGDILLVKLKGRWSNQVGSIVEVYYGSGRDWGLGRILELALDCCAGGSAFHFLRHSHLHFHLHFVVIHIHYPHFQQVHFGLYPFPACREVEGWRCNIDHHVEYIWAIISTSHATT